MHGLQWCQNVLWTIVAPRPVLHEPRAVQASAFATAMATAVNPNCNCDLTATITADAVETIIAEASAMASASVCISANPPGTIDLLLLVLTSCYVKHRIGQGAQILSMQPCFRRNR